MYYVYVIRSQTGKLYKGCTTDVEKRLSQHNTNDGFSSYTTSRGPWELVYLEEYTDKKQATGREKFLKTGKGSEFLKERLSAQADG